MKLAKLSSAEKTFIAISCLFIFLTSSSVQVFGGSCSSSPCGKGGDFMAESTSNTILNPLNLLTPYVLDLVGEFEITKQDSEFGRFETANSLYVGYFFDQKNDIVAGDSGDYTFDAQTLLPAFLALKVLTLLNVPIWILFSFFLLKIGQIPKYLGWPILALFIFFLAVPRIFIGFLNSFEYNVFDLFLMYLGKQSNGLAWGLFGLAGVLIVAALGFKLKLKKE